MRTVLFAALVAGVAYCSPALSQTSPSPMAASNTLLPTISSGWGAFVLYQDKREIGVYPAYGEKTLEEAISKASGLCAKTYGFSACRHVIRTWGPGQCLFMTVWHNDGRNKLGWIEGTTLSEFKVRCDAANIICELPAEGKCHGVQTN